MTNEGLLYLVIKEFCTAYLGTDRVSSVEMSYIVRKFSESYNE